MHTSSLRVCFRFTCSFLISLFSLAIPYHVYALKITEIMFDPPGADTGREWIEVFNDASEGNTPLAISSLDLKEADTRHKIESLPAGMRDTVASTIDPQSYAIIADNSKAFLIDHPDFQGSLFESSFSLKNDGEPVSIMIGDAITDTVNWNKGDADAVATKNAQAKQQARLDLHYSLQYTEGNWVIAEAHPGSGTLVQAHDSTSDAPPSSEEPHTNTSSITVSEGAASPLSVSPFPDSTTANHNSTATRFPVEPQIFAHITTHPDTKNAIYIGVPQLFAAEALGLKKEPLYNARFIWNFGDGTTVEGKNVMHVYAAPGTYVVFLEVGAGEWSAMDRVTFSVVAPLLSLYKNISSEHGENCTVHNDGSSYIDISGFLMRDERALTMSTSSAPASSSNDNGLTAPLAFTFPIGSLIAPHASISVPVSACYGDMRAVNNMPIARLTTIKEIATSSAAAVTAVSVSPQKKPQPSLSPPHVSVVPKKSVTPAPRSTPAPVHDAQSVAAGNAALAHSKNREVQPQMTLFVVMGLCLIASLGIYWKKASFGL